MASTNQFRTADLDNPELSELLSVRVSREDTAVVVTASGEIDLYTAPRLASALQQAIDDAHGGLVVVDLTDVTFMASSGISVLTTGLSHAQQRDCRILLAGGGRPVHRPLEAAGLHQHFEYVPSASDAVQHHSNV